MVSKSREVGIRLSVKDADIAERALKAFGKEGQEALASIQRAGKPASTSLVALNAAAGAVKGTFVGFTAGLAASLLPLLTVSALINGVRQSMEQLGDIADKSKSAGLDSEFFQGFAYQAKLAGVGLDEVSVALDTFNKNAGQAAEGRGRMVTALKGENAELLRNLQLAKNQEERLRIAADAIDKVDDANKKAALSTALFGNSGTKLVAAFEGGAAAIDATIGKARDLGIIIDRDTIAKADELGDKFDTAATIISTKFSKVLIELAPLLVWTAEVASGLATALNLVIDGFKGLEFKSTDTLRTSLTEIDKLIAASKQPELNTDANGQITVANPMDVQLDPGKVQELLAEKKKIEEILANRPSFREFPPGAGGGDSGDLPPNDAAKQSIKEAEALVKRLRTETETYSDTIADLKQKLDGGLITQETFNRGQAEAALKFAKSADEADEYAAAQQRLNEALERGAISQKQFDDASDGLAQKRLVAQNDWAAGVELGLMNIRKSTENVTTDMAKAVESWADNLSDKLAKVFRGGKFEWKDLLNTILDDAAAMTAKGLVGSLFGFMGGGGGGGLFGGAIIPGILHGGGTAGSDGYGHGRSFPPHLWAGAPRYHQGGIAGLRPNEVPAILERGEQVFRRGSGPSGSRAQVEVLVSVADDGRLVAVARQAGGDAADIRIRAASPQIVAAAVSEANKSAPGALAKFQAERGGSDHRVG